MFFKRAKSIEKRLEKIEVLEKRESKKLPIKINSCSKAGKDVLVIKNLNKSYGDKVIFNKYSGNEFILDQETYTIIKEKDILAIIEKKK